ncbi:MAG: hypothetical protein HYU66_20730 [Armatimonadetes bacterium]|nr:hypothetical protein [Armatimonadota bacterium]
MDAALRLRTTVLPGHRVEFVAPELAEGGEVEVIVLVPAANGAPGDRAPGLPADEEDSLMRFAGCISAPWAVGLDNDQIDADLAREYGSTHEEDYPS